MTAVGAPLCGGGTSRSYDGPMSAGLDKLRREVVRSEAGRAAAVATGLEPVAVCLRPSATPAIWPNEWPVNSADRFRLPQRKSREMIRS